MFGLHAYYVSSGSIGREPDGGLILRGDANARPDPTAVPSRMLLGEVRFVLPRIGLVSALAREHPMVAGVVIAASCGRLVLGGGATGRGTGHVDPGRRGARRWLVPATAVLSTVSLCVSATAATFSGSTSNAPSTFATATVTLDDDDSGTAMLNPTGLVPADTGSRCIAVTYTGSVPATVKLYTKSGDYTGTLGSYLTLTVEQGTGGSFAGGCDGFSPSSQLYSGTMSGFAGSRNSFGNGLGSFAPTAAGQVATFRFTYRLNPDNAARGLTSAITFTFEARNT